jgi:glycine cleavage system aminomethyltransferase T
MAMNEPTQLWFGPWYRRSPFFEATREAGCLGYDVYNHMLLPAGYAEMEEEYWQLKNHVAVWDVSVERNVEIIGPDALAFTNLLTPRDLTQCDIWQCKYVVITDENGGIINDPVLARIGENHFWLAAADSDLLLWAKGVAIYAEMDVEIREPDVSPMQIQGPKSKDVVQKLFGDRILEMNYYYCMETDLDGIPLVITRTGWTGEVGYEIYLRDGRHGTTLWERVMDAGEEFNIAPTAPNDIRRIEAGILNYGSDMTLDNNPYEVGLGWLVELDQEADFIGKEALRQIKARGIRRKLVGVEIHGDPIPGWPEEFWPVHHEGGEIGHMTAAVYSPGLEKNIGYALLPVEQARRGTSLKIDTPWGMVPATVVRKPFVDPKKDLPKS